MNTIKVYQNTFSSRTENYKAKLIKLVTNKGNIDVLFPAICNFIKKLILNLLETMEW